MSHYYKLTMESLNQIEKKGVNQLDWEYGYAPDLPPWLFIGASVYLFIIGTFGIIGNGSIILAFICKKQLQTPFNLVLMNLIVSEFIISAYGVPIDFTASILRGWKMGAPLCSATGFILTLVGMSSIYTLTGLSVQRCLLVSQYGQIDLHSKRTAAMILITIWTLSLAMALPPLMGWAFYAPESSGMSCAPSWETPENQTYNFFLIIFGFFAPLILLFFSSGSVLRTMQRNTSQLQTMIGRKSAHKRENKVNLMVLVMIGSFIFCWSPYALMSLYQMCGGQVSPYTSAFPMLFCKSSICTNPVIYVAMNSTFRDALIPSGFRRKDLNSVHSTLRSFQRVKPSKRVKIRPKLDELKSKRLSTISGCIETSVQTEVHAKPKQNQANDFGYPPMEQMSSTFGCSMMSTTDHQINSELLGEVEEASKTISK